MVPNFIILASPLIAGVIIGLVLLIMYMSRADMSEHIQTMRRLRLVNDGNGRVTIVLKAGPEAKMPEDWSCTAYVAAQQRQVFLVTKKNTPDAEYINTLALGKERTLKLPAQLDLPLTIPTSTSGAQTVGQARDELIADYMAQHNLVDEGGISVRLDHYKIRFQADFCSAGHFFSTKSSWETIAPAHSDHQKED